MVQSPQRRAIKKPVSGSDELPLLYESRYEVDIDFALGVCRLKYADVDVLTPSELHRQIKAVSSDDMRKIRLIDAIAARQNYITMAMAGVKQVDIESCRTFSDAGDAEGHGYVYGPGGVLMTPTEEPKTDSEQVESMAHLQEMKNKMRGFLSPR